MARPLPGITVHDRTGKLALVTGANSGLGLGLTERLAAAGAEVILAVRNREKGEATLAGVLAQHPTARMQVRTVDLA